VMTPEPGAIQQLLPLCIGLKYTKFSGGRQPHQRQLVMTHEESANYIVEVSPFAHAVIREKRMPFDIIGNVDPLLLRKKSVQA